MPLRVVLGAAVVTDDVEMVRLGHGLVDPLHGVAVPDEVAQVVALAQLQAQLLVLLHEPLPVGGNPSALAGTTSVTV